MLDGLNMAANEGDELGPERGAEVFGMPNEGDALVGPDRGAEAFDPPEEEAGEESGDVDEDQDLDVGQPVPESERQTVAEEGDEEQGNLRR
jgi:hypothetical protein